MIWRRPCAGPLERLACLFVVVRLRFAFDLVEGAFPLDFQLVGVAAGLVYGGVLAQSRSLLVVGIVSMLCYLAYYTNEYFADMVSWPVALIVLGLAMVGLSGYAVKLGRGMETRS